MAQKLVSWCVQCCGLLLTQLLLLLLLLYLCVCVCGPQAPGLPKTRSGKIMRRVLRKIAAKAEHELGDVSTLADPGVVEQLVALRGH